MQNRCYLAPLLALITVSGPVFAQANKSVMGEWGAVIKWPHVPAHMVQLNDGKMLTWAAATADDFQFSTPNYTVAAIFDPGNNGFQSTPNPRQNMFCAGLARTIDGRTMAVGGGAATYLSSLFNPNSNSWTATGDTWRRRWYPTSVTLPSGEIFMALGAGQDTLTELWSPTTNIWNAMWNVDFSPILQEYGAPDNPDYEWYPWLHVAPNGKLFYSGPTRNLYWVDPRGGSANNVELVGPLVPGNTRMRLWGNSIMYRPGQLLITGGRDITLTPPATNEAFNININGANPITTSIAPMNYARVFHHTLTLPTGEVMALGGNTTAEKFTDNGAILTPEMWNPAANKWRLLAPMSVARPYHSTAALMKDGRVLIVGGGVCGPCGANHPDGQIYSPPYLFAANGTAAARPSISSGSVPSTIRVGSSFTVKASTGIVAFNLIRLQATTHGIQTDHRFIPLLIAGSNRAGSRTEFTLATTNNANVLVPGDYWLYAVSDTGTPSVAATIRVTQ